MAKVQKIAATTPAFKSSKAAVAKTAKATTNVAHHAATATVNNHMAAAASHGRAMVAMQAKHK